MIFQKPENEEATLLAGEFGLFIPERLCLLETRLGGGMEFTGTLALSGNAAALSGKPRTLSNLDQVVLLEWPKEVYHLS